MLDKKIPNVGVIVGRFQIDDLHEGHRALIDSVVDVHERVIIFVGLSPCKCTVNNPLDFESRRSMIQSRYPDVTVMYIKDIHNDSLWSNDLDSKIQTLIGPEQGACLYGSRDSFIPYYNGKYETQELTQTSYISGSEVRKQLSVRSGRTKDFRAGACWAMANQWAGPKFTIDVAIFNDDFTKILLGRKKREDEFRVIGGFVSNGESLEDCVLREGKEETHLDLCDLVYRGSFPIDDWRYRGERDKITTVLFTAKIKSGKPSPDDDIHELRWFDYDENLIDKLVPNHKILIKALLGLE